MPLSPSVRQHLSNVMTVVCSVAVVVLVVSWWAEQNVLDSDRFAHATAKALDDPAVVEALALRATNQAVDLVLALADPRDLLPGPLQGLSGGAEQLLRGAVAEPMGRVIESDTVGDWLQHAARQAHAEAVAVVQDQRSPSGALARADGVVRLDLTGVLAAGLDALADRRLAPPAVAGAQEALRGGIDTFRAWVVSTTGVELDEHIGTVVVYDPAELDTSGLALRAARWGAELGSGRLVLATVAMVVSALGAVTLSRDRRRTVSLFGFSLAVTSVVSYFYWRQVASDIENLIDDPAIRSGVAVIVDEFARPLSIWMASLFMAGLLIAATAVWASRGWIPSMSHRRSDRGRS